MEKVREWINWLWGIITALLGLSPLQVDSMALRQAYEAQAAYIEAQKVYISSQNDLIANLLEERIILMWASLLLMILFNILSYTGWGKWFFDWSIDYLLRGWDYLRKSKLARVFFLKSKEENEQEGKRSLGANK